ncbi:MAG: hypothetical protein HRU20_22560 [Pseudomonadales bacterium]|nr:hypothetical protein [Pseudomonadales bacterium]
MDLRLLVAAITLVILGGCGSGSDEGNKAGSKVGGSNDAGSAENSIDHEKLKLDQNAIAVRVLTDGFSKSRLYIQGGDMWWLHINEAAPGRVYSESSAHYINDEIWYPIWPDEGHNAFCLCTSDTFQIKGFVNDIAIESVWIEDEIHIIQQPSESNDDIAIIEIQNLSSVPIWNDFTIKNIEYALAEDYTQSMFVDDLDDPLIDETAKIIYDESEHKENKLQNILADTVLLNDVGEIVQSNFPNAVYKSEWITLMAEELPGEFCKSSLYFKRCFNVSRDTCLTVASNETNRCLNEYADSIPNLLIQPNDGSKWGAEVGRCAGVAYEETLLDWKIAACN